MFVSNTPFLTRYRQHIAAHISLIKKRCKNGSKTSTSGKRQIEFGIYSDKGIQEIISSDVIGAK